VGEVSAAVLLLKRIRAAYPGVPIILSTITDTGRKVASEKAPAGTHIIYLPFDFSFVLRRVMAVINPRILIVMETELWPNLFKACAARGIRVLLLNGRISEKSARGYRRISFFMREVLRAVSICGMQSAVDAERLLGMGAEASRVRVLGNFKFEMDMPDDALPWAAGLHGPVIVAGSTHPGEEEIILSAWQENLERYPDLTLVLAPRHPERFADVAELLSARGISFVKRSELTGGNAAGAAEGGVILLDSIGELAGVYRIADMAIMGKSFRGTGGQNPLEPAYWGKAIICGPHMENFPFIRDFYREGAAFEVEEAGLPKKIRELLVSPEKARAAGRAARDLYAKNSGAVDRAMAVINEFLG
jgi:3-deoxy-D-manno-octulosonic-acid transferase